jgi:hypothetical protein
MDLDVRKLIPDIGLYAAAYPPGHESRHKRTGKQPHSNGAEYHSAAQFVPPYIFPGEGKKDCFHISRD